MAIKHLKNVWLHKSQGLTLHTANISLSFRVEKHTQALFQTLKSELKFPWETQPHHPFLHASTRHVDWPNSSPTFHFLFCHLFKTIYFPHVSNCADSHSVGHANKGSSTVDEWTHKFDHTNRWSYSKLAVNWKWKPWVSFTQVGRGFHGCAASELPAEEVTVPIWCMCLYKINK